MKKNTFAIIVFLSAFSFSLFSQSNSNKILKELSEQDKIDYLIGTIEQLDGAQFYRNGTWNDAKTAADHLRMKRSKAGNRIKTALDFIDKIASESSMSGEAYKIKYADGKIVTSKEYFTGKLKEIEGS
jgi:hypothetical protein